MITVVLGAPGTGKTHYLINKVQEALEAGIAPERIGYFSFTNRAADEARRRVIESLGLPLNQFTFFRTLHSLAFRQISLDKNRVFSKKKMDECAEWLGLRLSRAPRHAYTRDETWPEKTEDDRILFLLNYGRVCMLDADETMDLNWRAIWAKVDWVRRGYNKFKDCEHLYDFTDMLEQLVFRGIYPKLDLIIVDEAQDLSALQWSALRELRRSNNADIFLAGDDDQGVYEWAGADIRRFARVVKQADSVIELQQSHRVPKNIFALAYQTILGCVKRVQKTWQPTKNEGHVGHIKDIRMLQWDLTKSCLCLARTNYLLKPMIDYLNQHGLPWSWISDKTKTPIKVSTIHGAKGAQADRVILDLTMSKAAYNGGFRTDAEARVWYVGMTRASDELIFIGAKNKRSASLYIGPLVSYL